MDFLIIFFSFLHLCGLCDFFGCYFWFNSHINTRITNHAYLFFYFSFFRSSHTITPQHLPPSWSHPFGIFRENMYFLSRTVPTSCCVAIVSTNSTAATTCSHTTTRSTPSSTTPTGTPATNWFGLLGSQYDPPSGKSCEILLNVNVLTVRCLHFSTLRRTAQD